MSIEPLVIQQRISRHRYEEMIKQRDMLRAKVERSEGSALLSNWELDKLKEKGLTNPLEDLADDLMRHAELIPYKGVMGGTMGFYAKDDIHVVTSRWVLASFEDGHMKGRMLLEYQVSPKGKIYWRVISAYLE